MLLKVYAAPTQIFVPFLSSVAQRNRLGLFLLALSKSCDDILEPKLDELIHQLGSTWDSGVVEDDQVFLDLNSNLGIFLQWYIHAFNLLSFENICHLLTNNGIYCKEVLSRCPSYEEPCLDYSDSNLETYSEYENMDLENFVYEKVTEEIEVIEEASERVPFHLHAPKSLLGLVDEIDVPADPACKPRHKGEAGLYGDPQSNMLRDIDRTGLPYASASLSFCQSFNLDLLKASATLTLAELLFSLGSSHATRALNLIHGAFPMILGHGGLELCSQAYITEAKCYLSDTNFKISENYEVVIDSLSQASDEVQLLEYHELAAEAFYLIAMVYDKLGRLIGGKGRSCSFIQETYLGSQQP